jgi:hypothetical protein
MYDLNHVILGDQPVENLEPIFADNLCAHAANACQLGRVRVAASELNRRVD